MRRDDDFILSCAGEMKTVARALIAALATSSGLVVAASTVGRDDEQRRAFDAASVSGRMIARPVSFDRLSAVCRQRLISSPSVSID
jgi:hypothetical protein